MLRKMTTAVLLMAALVSTPMIAQADMVLASNNATVQPGGPRAGGSGKNFFNVEGSANGNFASYGVVDFQFVAPGSPLAGISSMSIALTESNAAFTTPGAVLFYLDISSPLVDIEPGTSPLFYDGTGPGTGTDVSEGDLTLLELGGGPFTFTGDDVDTNGTVNLYNFSLSSQAETAVLDRFNNGNTIRLVVAPGDDTVAATWAGFSNTTFAGPTLTITAVPEPSSMALLGVIAGGFFLRRRLKANA